MFGKIFDFDTLSVARATFVARPPTHRECVFIESKVNNFALRFGDFFEIDTPSRARLRRPPQPAKVRLSTTLLQKYSPNA